MVPAATVTSPRCCPDEPIDGAIVAAPTGLHEEVGLRCIDAGVPALIEKPICATVESAERLNRAAEQAGVPLLVGHHRRYNPAAAAAKRLLDAGALGRLVGISAIWCMCKPDSYYAAAWRRQPGGGPVLTNLIHEIDLLRYLAGDIIEVAGFTANAVRGFATEDSAALTLRFAGGALASVVMSDCAPSPWSWEQARARARSFPPTSRIRSACSVPTRRWSFRALRCGATAAPRAGPARSTPPRCACRAATRSRCSSTTLRR